MRYTLYKNNESLNNLLAEVLFHSSQWVLKHTVLLIGTSQKYLLTELIND